MGHFLSGLEWLRGIRDGVLIFIQLLVNQEQFRFVLAYYPEMKSVIPPEVIEISAGKVWLREFFLGTLMVVNLGYITWVVKRLF